MNHVLVLCSCFAFIIWSSAGLQCRDEDGSRVDWFVVYKMPMLGRKDVGERYYRLSSSGSGGGWLPSNRSILSHLTPPANTLKPFYSNRTQEVWVMYNDQVVKNEEAFGHTKGVVGAGKEGGFWLVHSVPHYPTLSETEYAYPTTGLRFGQTFLCLSLQPSELNILGSNILRYNNPNVFKFREGTGMEEYKDLIAAGKGKRITSPPWFKKTILKTLSQMGLQVYAKTENFGKDLYKWVAKDLGCDLAVETWRNEKSKLPSSCDNKNKVMNVNSISMNGINFGYTHDHSKWAVSWDKNSPWICIGDINRDASQETRGGGTVCVENADLWNAFLNITQSIERCPGSYSIEDNEI